RFFLAIFRSEPFQERIKENSHGGAMQNLVGMDVFRKTVFPLPATATEQEAIAYALSDVDAVINTLDTLLSKKRELKIGARPELLTGRRRLSGFETRPGHKQTDVGVIPEDWEVKPVGTMGEVRAGKALAAKGPGQQRPYLRTKNVLDGRIDLDDVLWM